MVYKSIEKQDLELMLNFIDDENTKYDIGKLRNFMENDNNFGFIAKENNKIVGFVFRF